MMSTSISAKVGAPILFHVWEECKQWNRETQQDSCSFAKVASSDRLFHVYLHRTRHGVSAHISLDRIHINP